uniref:Uncharacterized protein n=1 Tax=Oryza rufipogon TaxID=4529 RepID=A0A0E0MSU5_ORYRU
MEIGALDLSIKESSILGDARCFYGSQVANHTMFDYDNLKLSKLVFAIFVLLTPYLDNYQDNGEHDKERSNSYKHRNQSWTGTQSIRADPILPAGSWHQVAGLCEGHSCNRLAGSVGRPDKAAIRMLKNQVQMVDRFAECPGLSKQQVWRVRPAVVRKKMRRKLTGAMAMPALGSTDT